MTKKKKQKLSQIQSI